MREEYPVDEQIVVLKNGQRLGPFEIDEILDLLESGELDYGDVCLREGASECERLGEVLDWDRPKDDEIDEEIYDDDDEDIVPSSRPASILYSGHPSILSFPVPLFCVLGGVTGGIWMHSSDGWYDLVFYLIAVASLAHIAVVRFTSDYLITPKRIELIRGLVARSSKEVRVQDLRAINVRCTGLLGVLGIGDVDFFTTGDDPEITFHNIWAAKKVKSLVRKLQDRDG